MLETKAHQWDYHLTKIEKVLVYQKRFYETKSGKRTKYASDY